MRQEEPDLYLAATGFSVGGYTPDQDSLEEERRRAEDSEDGGDEIEIEEERAER